MEERRKLIWHLGERHVDRMCKKNGRPCLPRPDLAHKIQPWINILLQIYRGKHKGFQKDVTFHVYHYFLGYGVNTWDGHFIGEEEAQDLKEKEDSDEGI